MAVFCPNCGAENRDTARFCIQCGATTTPELICPACRTPNPDNARFCLQCGTPIRGATPAAGLTGLLPANALLSNRYVILRRVGKGGMGAVYQASDTRLSSKVWALKEMSDAAILDPAEKQQARDAFQREAQMLATLDHPNLPKVNDFFIESGKLYLVMDYVDGQTLEDLLDQSANPLPEAQVLPWAEQLCDVLDYLHRCTPPIIFRDLKPGNIMLDRSGRIKLIDFGVARLFKTGQARDTANFGTAGYAPPEQYGKGQTDARSDVYALGVTLHQLLTRYDPALTPFNLPPARNVNPAISTHIEQALVRATQSLQVNRFQRTLEFKAALLAPAANAPKATPASQPQPQRAPAQPQAAMPYGPVPTLGRVIQPSFSFEPEMIVIPAGEFVMGSDRVVDRLAGSDELPRHRVYLDQYSIGKFPITQGQYQIFVQATGHRLPLSGAEYGKFYKWDSVRQTCPPGNQNHPVVLIDWHDALAYCNWLAHETGRPYRLPTEAEWEKAARGTDDRIYPWGNTKPINTLLNFGGQFSHTTEVGRYADGASPFGALDMAGNVREWLADWYEGFYDTHALRNPTGPASGVHRVLRGGSFTDSVQNVRVACRFRHLPNTQSEVIGVRVAYSR